MNLKENLRRSKEVLGAYWRQGLHELGSVFYGPGTAAQHAEYGMIATKTPGQVADGLRPEGERGQSREESGPSVLEAYPAAASDRQRDEPVRELELPERERE